ncbi:anaerobic ribonucleoside-triphosphate reductase activating protein [Peptacetobacter hominis]|uniref:Anaerobic ribonucleoside-triphosphate reductase-activating protein n=1 Tax=Peptacetobacter hominis TaxID=2743610 RepID=A0A544QSW8_9FIRM|nr:anaerobic ribonucleoside-triphosphate reductase activating protein [Peptacetobacter hominis]TQQ83139.1 anaerobic ribonucleoside-triphosphate reductase activating protein [Peptacetobacter hominis]
MKIRLASKVTFDSIVDGPGLRAVVWTQGCTHNCMGCHNPQTHSLNGGFIEDTDNIVKEIKERKLQRGVTLSGGEPFLQPEAVEDIARKLKETGMDVWAFTGFKFEELLNPSNKNFFINKKLLKSIDVLVDGKFEIDKRDISLLFRGSSNQRVIDVKRSLKEKRVVLKEEYVEGYVDTFLPMAK